MRITRSNLIPVLFCSITIIYYCTVIFIFNTSRDLSSTTDNRIIVNKSSKKLPIIQVGKPLPILNSTGWPSLPRGRLLCAVHTAVPSHDTLARAAYDLWSTKCDAVLFFTNGPIQWDDVKDIPPHVYFPTFNTRKHSWEKIIHVMRYIYYNTGTQFDWILRADDDAFVFVDNARTLINRHDSSHPYLFGFRWNFFSPFGYADGSTYILSRTTLKAFVDVSYDAEKCPEFHKAEEDQEFSLCLSKVGITPADARDPDGRERFYQFHPTELDLNRNNFLKGMAYYRYLPYPDYVSRSTVSMHHLAAYEMYLIDFLVYKVVIADEYRY